MAIASASVFDGAFRAQLRELFRWRRDVRRFRPEPVPAALLEELLDAACLAPSVGLSQPWRFEACNAEASAGQHAGRAALYARLKLAGLDEAPCRLAVFAEPDPEQGRGLGRRTMPETVAYSAVMAVHTLWLAARAAGLGLGWVSILDPAVVAAALDIPKDWTLIGCLCLGYPRADSDAPELECAGREHRRTAAACLVRR